ncbi:G-protein alpha subunit-domain-containing protein [Lactarius hengduanensis]|nr:G-protein alpha subunit-domain-containing protein [Lactarius hengduanensis]
MVAAKSVPQNRRLSSNDPFEAVLRPPPDETPAQREMRILAEQQASKPDVKILLLGQSESGKSTTLKRRSPHHSSFWARYGRIYIYVSDGRMPPLGLCLQASIYLAQFQLLHTPAAFQAERIAWRTVIYLNLVRSVRRSVLLICRALAQLIAPTESLDTISAEREEEIFDTASITKKHAEYSGMLAPVLELEGRLIHRLREDDEDDEANPSRRWEHPRLVYATRRRSSKRIPTSTPWWDDPSDPVHVLDRCRDAMVRLWDDEWVRNRLVEKRVRLQESSGFYLDQIERITAKDYSPTDDDVLKARLKTVGVVEHPFTISMGTMRGNTSWVITMLAERATNAMPQNQVNSIIFLAPISAFDQVLTEDTRVNRLEDSLLLWRAVISNKLLGKVPIVLFLNKCDLLREKLEAGVRLKSHLVTYGDRPNDYESVSKYLRNKFGQLHNQNSPNHDRELFIHYTSVVDKEKTAQIIASVREAILRLNLKTLRLM